MKRALYILGQLDDLDIEWLIQNGKRDPAPAGTVLIREKAPNENLYVVLSGEFAVSIQGAGAKGQSRQIAKLGSGEMLGEVSLVDGSAASATVTASADAAVLRVPHSALTARLEEDPAFSGRFYKAISLFLADRLRSTVRQLERSGGAVAPLDDEEESADEVNLNVLENVHLAGRRFLRILEVLQGS